MSHVKIQRATDGERTLPVFREMEERFEAVRRRAFDLFAGRGGMFGRDLDDWIEAEREIMGHPPANLMERDGAYEVEVTLPGFAADEIEVTATPSEVIVRAATSEQHSDTTQNIVFSEFSSTDIVRSFGLPASVDADKITASLDKGILRVRAPKADSAEADAKKIEVKAPEATSPEVKASTAPDNDAKAPEAMAGAATA